MMTGLAFPLELERFRSAYAEHRASEGRAHSGTELRCLPFLRSGPLARQWAVRAKTYQAFQAKVVSPLSRRQRPLRILDLGSGNGWLSYRLAMAGHDCAAIDLREDCVDGLGAAAELARHRHFDLIAASFEHIPLPSGEADLAVFNASLHYAIDLQDALTEAARLVRHGGCISILDSPFYADELAGLAMVEEKRESGIQTFGDRANALLGLPFIEFLTRERLARASAKLGLVWRRRRVIYPLWYEMRSIVARIQRRRVPSRFDLWTAQVP